MRNSWNVAGKQPGDTEILRTLTRQIRSAILQEEDPPSDEKVRDMIDRCILQDRMTELYSFREKRRLAEAVFHATRSDLDLIQPLAEAEDISEIMVNGTEGIFVERNGLLEKLPIRFESREDLEEVIRRLAGRVHREINEQSPIVDARMEDGSRINAVYRNVALNGPILTIRKFPRKRITMEELLQRGTLTGEAADFLEHMVRGGSNLFISGGTGSGKTTFLSVLTTYIPKQERVIVIEDSAELQIPSIENIVRMETRSANGQGAGAITARQLIRSSLRMRPDRIVVGEVRGEEVLDMLQAMNTGHDGSLSTGHGNSPEGMLRRLETMYLTAVAFPLDAIRRQIAEALDLIVHLGRMPDGSRKVLEIVEISGYENGEILLNPLFCYTKGKGLLRTQNPLKNRGKLEMRGITV